MSFNPGANNIFGLQWPVTREGIGRADKDMSPVAAVFTSASAETIDQMGVYLTSVQGASGSKWELEIYNVAALDSGAAGSSNYLPDTDVTYPYIKHDGANPTTPPFYTHIDEVTPDYADYIQASWGAPFPTIYGARFANIAGSLAGKVITSVRLRAWVAAMPYIDVGATAPSMSSGGLVVIDGAGYGGQGVSYDANQPAVFIDKVWPVNPATGVSWKISEVEKLDTDADSYAGLMFSPTGSWNWVHRCYAMYLTVEWGTTERRVAVGTLTNPVVGRNHISLATPTGTDNWAKGNGTRYLVLLRRKSGEGSISVRWLDSGAACPHVAHGSALPVYTADGRLDGVATTQLAQTPAYCLTMLTSGAAVSADSQPYASANGDTGVGEGAASATWTRVHATASLEQEFTGAVGTYRSVAILVRSAQATPPTQPLSIEVRLRSTGVRQGSELVIQPSDLVAPITQWQVVRKNLDPTSATLGANQYYFDIQSTTPSTAAWDVQVLSGVVASTYDSATLGGTTDILTVQGADRNFADAVITLGLVVTVPTGFAASLQNRSLTSPNLGTCSLTTLREVRLAWNATALGANFARYEIQRKNQSGAWQDIARITTESVTSMVDQEAAIANNEYRMRVVRTDNSVSDYTGSAFAFPEWYGGPGLIFCSNESTGLAVGYETEGPPERTYEFLSADTVEVHRYQGRDYQVAYRDLEERGVSFTVRCMVNGLVTPVRQGEPVFAGLRAIAAASLSYVCVKDRDGNTWYASMRVTEGERIEPGRIYNANVEVLQTTATPAPVNAT